MEEITLRMGTREQIPPDGAPHPPSPGLRECRNDLEKIRKQLAELEDRTSMNDHIITKLQMDSETKFADHDDLNRLLNMSR